MFERDERRSLWRLPQPYGAASCVALAAPRVFAASTPAVPLLEPPDDQCPRRVVLSRRSIAGRKELLGRPADTQFTGERPTSAWYHQ
jgi:hypothetical protein